MLATLFVPSALGFSAPKDEFLDWECPGMPCFIVNAYEYRPYAKITQTCGYVDEHDPCQDLADATPFTTGNSSAPWTHKVTRAHPCQDYWGCHQTECTQGSVKACYGLCDKMQLLYSYNSSCYDYCLRSTGCS